MQVSYILCRSKITASITIKNTDHVSDIKEGEPLVKFN